MLKYLTMLFTSMVIFSACSGGSSSSIPGVIPQVSASYPDNHNHKPKATPSPTSSPTPTASPTNAPIISSVFSTNGVSFPAGWQPYGQSSVWNQIIPASPTIALNSQTIINEQFSGNVNGYPFRNQEPGLYDPTHPIYFAASTDPLITIDCSQVKYGCTGMPAQINMPALARTTQDPNDDGHITIVSPTGEEYDMYCWNSTTIVCNPPNTGNWGQNGNTTFTPNVAADDCGNFYTGSGMNASGAPTTAGYACDGAGLISVNDLQNGVINHALFLIVNCAMSGVYPSPSQAATDACTDGNGPNLGQVLWYDVPDATTNASNLTSGEKAVLNALHDHGGFIMDDINGGTIAGGIAFEMQSEEPAYQYGLGDQWAVMGNQGWSGTIIGGTTDERWTLNNAFNGVDWLNHMHYLNPCVAQLTC